MPDQDTPTHAVQGREVTFPVEVRDARQWAVQYLVPARAAQEVVDYGGLEVAQPLPGKAVLSLVVVEYLDTDLDAYHEVGVSFLVRPHDAEPAEGRELVGEFFRGELGVFIHQLPVDQTFTLEAGVGIWGFPKFLAEIDIHDVGRRTVCTLRHDGEHVFTIDARRGGPVRLPQRTPPAYSFHDGVLRRTPWESWGLERGGVLGGAEIELGGHPIAKELAGLGLPKRAVMTATVGHLAARFRSPEIVTPTRRP